MILYITLKSYRKFAWGGAGTNKPLQKYKALTHKLFHFENK